MGRRKDGITYLRSWIIKSAEEPIDETWASTNVTRSRGRGPRGSRLVMKVPKTTTFIAGLRVGGLTAPTAVDGAVNGDVFEAYVRQQLVPIPKPGDVVVMDNLTSHERAGAREAIEAAGAMLLYLPPYSPDLNPMDRLPIAEDANWGPRNPIVPPSVRTWRRD